MYPFRSGIADQDPIVLDGRPQDPVRLTHALLETVIDRVRRLYGDRPHELVLTYPLFPPGGSAALLDRVAEASAVERARVLPHPVAAAAKLAQDVDISVGTTVAVLDFGGGSFEATVVRRTSDGFDVVGPPGGLADLGGVEIDDAVFARVDAALGHVLQTVAPDDAEGMAAVRRLRTACRAAKEQLSYSAETTVEVALPQLSTWVPITRRGGPRRAPARARMAGLAPPSERGPPGSPPGGRTRPPGQGSCPKRPCPRATLWETHRPAPTPSPTINARTMRGTGGTNPWRTRRRTCRRPCPSGLSPGPRPGRPICGARRPGGGADEQPRAVMGTTTRRWIRRPTATRATARARAPAWCWRSSAQRWPWSASPGQHWPRAWVAPTIRA